MVPRDVAQHPTTPFGAARRIVMPRNALKCPRTARNDLKCHTMPCDASQCRECPSAPRMPYNAARCRGGHNERGQVQQQEQQQQAKNNIRFDPT